MAASTLEVLISGNSSPLTAALGVATAKIKGFALESARAGSGLTKAFSVGAVAGGAIAVAAIAKGIQATQQWAASVRSLQLVTGQSAEQASALAGAAGILGIGVDKLNTSFGLLSKNIVNGSKNFDKYGIATRDAAGAMLPFDTILGNVADAFQKLPAGPEQAALALNVFGRSGKELIPILARGNAGLQELKDSAVAAGLVMSQDTLDASRRLTIAQRELGDAFKGAGIKLGVSFIPVVTSLTNGVTTLVEEFQKVPQPLVVATLKALMFAGALVIAAKAATALKGATTSLLGEDLGASVLQGLSNSLPDVATGLVLVINGIRGFHEAQAALKGDFRTVFNIVKGAATQFAPLVGAIPDLLPPPKVAEATTGLKLIQSGLASGALTATSATAAIDALSKATGVTFPQSADQMIAAMQSSISIMEKSIGTNNSVRRLFDEMGTSVGEFRTAAVAAATASSDAFQAFVDQTLASATQAWQGFKDSATSALTFTDDALRTLQESAQSALDTLAGDTSNLNSGALQALRAQAHVTARDILQSFQDAAAKTKDFGQNLLELARTGGKAGRDLARSLLESGDVMSAQIIADAPKTLQRQIIGAFGKSQSAADTFSTKLTDAIVGPLNDIKKLLIAIAAKWGVTVDLHADEAQNKLKGLKYQLDNISAKNYNVDVIVHTKGGSPMPDEALKMHLTDPMARMGFKKISGRWTLPLDVSVHTGGNIGNVSAAISGFESGAGSQVGAIIGQHKTDAILKQMEQQAKKTGELHLGVLRDLLREQKSAKWVAAWADQAQRAFAAGLKAEKGPPKWYDLATKNVPRLPEGTHGRNDRHVDVRITRPHMDDAMSYQTDYSGYG